MIADGLGSGPMGGNKPSIPERLFDEQKEPCFGCGKEWYVIHHKDGLCRACQHAGKRGREATRVFRRNIFFACEAVFVTAILIAWWLMR